ncbi:hypothetical protein [Salinarimonas rosea]|uniref:hypothetical protein n=1 Tax=Salinarimonas rosea TaxID=552063 RepID=UPI00040FEB06|nr:hypothetical protein [Salinarimonas rosea]
MRSRLPALVVSGVLLTAGSAAAQDSAISFFLMDRNATESAVAPTDAETGTAGGSLLEALSRASDGRDFGEAVSAAAPGRSGPSGRDFGAAVSQAASGRGSDGSDVGGTSSEDAGSGSGSGDNGGGGGSGGSGNGGGNGNGNGNGNGGGNGRS